ncbi:hypothetical protein H6G97_51350 [Nostoc flagelliforme FACHB-838]|uniref:Uncharacterized protein n=1 Tax=Nostoc flagelliforme FACHB-838 TaxID=2692904 RepID=A0ABR8E6C5_9NOSO|nr:hypothetical protein [Nostoc flagelliforme FACHB-838]
MVQQLFTQGSLFDLQTVIDYGQSVINVAQELAKVLIWLFVFEDLLLEHILKEMGY